MAASIAHLGAVFNTHRMVMEYTDLAYFPAHRAGATLASNDHRPAEELAEWRTRAAAVWPGVSVRSQLADDQGSLRVGNGVQGGVYGEMDLGNLLDGDVRPTIAPQALFTTCLDWLGADATAVLGARDDALACLRG